MTQLRDILKKIFGRFWFLLFKDTWLLLNIIILFLLLLGVRADCFITNTYKQTAVNCGLLSKFSMPLRILTQLISSCKHSTIPLASSLKIKSRSLFNIGQTDSQGWLLPIVSGGCDYQSLRTKVLDSFSNNKNIDKFKFTDLGIVIYTDPAKLNLKSITAQISDSLHNCSVLWGIKQSYPDIQDHFSGIMQLPKLWVYMYPLSMLRAYSAHVFGATLYDALFMLGLISGFPIASLSGTVTKILNKTIFINNVAHTGCTDSVIGVVIGQLITKGDPLFKDSSGQLVPAALTSKSKDTLFSWLTGIDVLTSVGTLTAQNRQLSVSQNILPLTGTRSTTYKAACLVSDYNKYVTLPATVNPMMWLIKKAWKKHFILFKLANRNLTLQASVLSFIKKNIRKDAILYAYTQNTYVAVDKTLLLQNNVILYYNTSINNKYTILVNCYDL